MSLQKIIHTIAPRKLFLIDSLGALVSALMLGVVLVKLEPIFGVPSKTLYFLAAIACVFSIYSFLGFLGITKKWRPYMTIIATANLLYCCLTIGMVSYLHEQVSILGYLYFIGEILIISILAFIELKVAARPSD